MKPINPNNFGVGAGLLECTAILNTGVGVENCSIVAQVGGRHYNLASISTPSRTLPNCFLVSGTPANLGEMNIAVTAYGEGTATHASYVVNGSASSTLTLTAVATGTSGNAITIALTAGGTAGSEVVTVTGNAISVQIASGTSTVAQVNTALTASTPAAALVTATHSGTGTLTAPLAATHLAGGAASTIESAKKIMSHQVITYNDNRYSWLKNTAPTAVGQAELQHQ